MLAIAIATTVIEWKLLLFISASDHHRIAFVIDIDQDFSSTQQESNICVSDKCFDWWEYRLTTILAHPASDLLLLVRACVAFFCEKKRSGMGRLQTPHRNRKKTASMGGFLSLLGTERTFGVGRRWGVINPERSPERRDAFVIK
jgi:hypothetical protein